MKMPLHNLWSANASGYILAKAGELAGISEGLLIYWISTERFVPSVELERPDIFDEQKSLSFQYRRFLVTDDDLQKLRQLVEGTVAKRDNNEAEIKNVKHIKGTHYTVQELGIFWDLGVDKIRELFENEPGVIKLQKAPRKGRRPYTTLRIPENIAERVQRRNS
jgi:hypothetical protein